MRILTVARRRLTLVSMSCRLYHFDLLSIFAATRKCHQLEVQKTKLFSDDTHKSKLSLPSMQLEYTTSATTTTTTAPRTRVPLHTTSTTTTAI